MGAFFTALVVVIPILEVVVFAVVADALGVLPAVVLLVVVSVAGAVLLVREGVGTWRRFRETIRRRERPTDELTDAALIVVGAVLLLTPGFFTDCLAFAVVIPPTRRALGNLLRRAVMGAALSRTGRRSGVGGVVPRVHDVRATVRPTKPGSAPPSPPPQLPSSEHRRDAGGSPDRG